MRECFLYSYILSFYHFIPAVAGFRSAQHSILNTCKDEDSLCNPFNQANKLPMKCIAIHPLVVQSQHLFQNIPDTTLSPVQMRDVTGNLFYFNHRVSRTGGKANRLHRFIIRQVIPHIQNHGSKIGRASCRERV